jgi:membrane protease YdiL (CAAX protease family)
MFAMTSSTPRRLGCNTLVPLLEIGVILTPVVTIIWIMPLLIEDKARREPVNSYLVIITILIGLGLNLYRREGPNELGLRLDNLTRAIGELFWFTLAGSVTIVAIGLGFGSVNFGVRFLKQLAVLFFWGLLQHYGAQGLVNRRLQTACGPGWRSVWITAVIFSALHLPNPTLTVATLIGGYFWSSAFQRHPNLIAIALTHALLSALLANSFPRQVMPNMKVGWGFF